MAKQPPKPEQLKFDQAMQELEQLVEQIESGQVDLEEALRQYERGVALIKRCRQVLDTAEQRISELTQDEEGRLTTTNEQPDIQDNQTDDEPKPTD